MITFADQWDPKSALSWATRLGMVHVPMFGKQLPKAAQEAAILLDGYRGSFAFLRTEDARFAEATDPISWTWSSCVRHLVTILPDSQRMLVRRWDEPETTRKFKIPTQAIGGLSLLKELEVAPEPRRPNVIRHVLEPFRQIRQHIGQNDALLSVKLLNSLLLIAEAVQKRRQRDIRAIRHFGDAFSFLSEKDLKLCGLAGIPHNIAALPVRDLLQSILEPDSYTGCELNATLLFRHAASRLYQEAHLEIERNPERYLLGLEPTGEPVGAPSARDVRFTPPNLARALVQKALEVLPDNKADITILDPACGSGVFLIEAIRELCSVPAGTRPKITAVGYDISEISEYTTRFCLQYATPNASASRSLQTQIMRWDSLAHPWSRADVVLMNPPFIPWERMSTEQQHRVTQELGDAAQKRPDIAMAFVIKAVRSLRPGGVLGCVLPAALLTNQTGVSWREQLSEQGNLRLLGYFEGYKYFPTSLVETAFVIYQKKSEHANATECVEVLISDEGREDAALRALRLERAALPTIAGVERFDLSSQTLTKQSWRPLRQESYQEKNHIMELALPRINDLFEIKQGIRTGHRQVFVLNATQYEELNHTERRFFRAAAGGGSIRNGQLHPAEYVFHPYATDGSLLCSSEEELEALLPIYYRKYLSPAKQKLASRNRPLSTAESITVWFTGV